MIWIALFVVAASASDSAAYTVPIGRGIETCQVWSADKTARDARSADEEWLYGFVSGADSIAAKSYEKKLVWPSDYPLDFVSFVDRYCAAHPRETVDEAARALTRKLAKDGGL